MGLEKTINIRGARVHNLRSVDVSIPRERLVVITGVSGSGKSSLAFDTLFAEGHRKFMDSLSTRARAAMEQLPRPEVDYIEGLTPVVAIEQRTGGGGNPRSTVATITETADYARLLWSLAGEAFCPEDGGRIVQQTLDDNLDRLQQLPESSRLILLAPYLRAKVSVLRGEIAHLRQKGFQRVRINGTIFELEDPDLLRGLKGEVEMQVVVDRLVIRPDQRSRMADSLELAFREGGDRAFALVQPPGDDKWQELVLSQHFSCVICGKVYAPVTARLFSWDHPEGACPTCGGLGETLQFNPDWVVPDTSKSVRGGAIKPWRLGSKRMIIERNAILKQLAEQYPFDPTLPWHDLPEEVRTAILHGTGERLFMFKTKPGKRAPVAATFPGVLAHLVEMQSQTSSDGLRARLMTYQTRSQCPACHGARLNPFARSVLLGGLSYDRFMRMSLAEAQTFARQLDLPLFAEAVSGLRSRLQFLNQVGLGYLSLDRPYDSLSGGEAQRVRLATQVGMGLAGVTYILDEPTVGLHPANTAELLATLKELRERGNSVVVVEHDPDVMRAADYLIELGPGAGESGGRLLFAGSVSEAMASAASLSGRYLAGHCKLTKPVPTRAPTAGFLHIHQASENNLKHIDVAIPLGLLTVVTGVSGSGKSTLINDILGRSAAAKLNHAKTVPGRHAGIAGLENFEKVVRVDQDPIGRSPRSNPATFTKLFDDLRKLFAQTPLAKVRGYGPGRFSFNVRGGRCERCQGDGAIRMDMHFLSDVFVECPACRGQRYNRETLEVRFKGLSIADVLNLSVDQAVALFAHQPRILSKLETLQAVGLGYIRLGQSAPTLSGGEAQRLKLSLELSKSRHAHNLYLLDEPTTGLHWRDIEHLMELLFRLRDQGHTLVLIEHNMDVVKMADWILDMGPGGGETGGHLLYAGPLSGLPTAVSSLTKNFL